METTFENAVAEVFRAMMPIFNNKSKSVITPLLATGCQHADEMKMMKAMISSAVNWMRAGLPLQLLKIVVYCRDAKPPAGFASDYIDVFKQFEQKLNRKPPTSEDPAITNDVYLIHSETDQQLADRVVKSLKRSKNQCKKLKSKKLTVITLKDVVTKETSWHYDIVTAMMSSASVVPLLTTSFMENSQCIDQYNLAMCADRRTNRKLLNPFCCDVLTDLPVYMTAVQWSDCRSKTDAVIQEACSLLMTKVETQTTVQSYDVFVSYSHRNSQQADILLQALKKHNPDIQVFFDKHELRTGDRWQTTLYKALDNTRCVVALLSADYLSSRVCNEELNLAVLRHLTSETEAELVLLCIDSNVPVDLPLFCFIRPVTSPSSSNSGNVFESSAEAVAQSVCQWLKDGTKDGKVFSPVETSVSIASLAEQQRQKAFESGYTLSDKKGLHVHSKVPPDPSVGVNIALKPSFEDVTDVFVVCAAQDRRIVSFLAAELRLNGFKVIDESTTEDSGQIESASCVVVILSCALCSSPRKVEDLNLTLGRARSARPIYVIAVDSLPSSKTPSYIQLIPCEVCIRDGFWQEQVRARKSSVFRKEITDMRMKLEKKHGQSLSDAEILSLLKASCDIQTVCHQARNGVLQSSAQKDVLASVVDLYAMTHETLPTSLLRKHEATETSSYSTSVSHLQNIASVDAAAAADDDNKSQGLTNTSSSTGNGSASPVFSHNNATTENKKNNSLADKNNSCNIAQNECCDMSTDSSRSKPSNGVTLNADNSTSLADDDSEKNISTDKKRQLRTGFCNLI